MQSVSSNAVAGALSVYNTETETGGKWIDGKKIYRYGVKVSANYSAGTAIQLMNLSNINYSVILKINCTIWNRNMYWTNGDETGRSKVYIDNPNKILYAANVGTSDYGNSDFYAYIEYTKS